MKILSVLAIAAALLTSAQAVQQPSAHTKGTPTGEPTGPLKPGEYWWKPQLSPSGPLMVLVSVPEQTMHVYRNGILIGRSTVSTGSQGHATPGGVFGILEKKQEHYSKKYNNAPMPNMQRLTWTGIAMHSGNLPGYPASHGCIRLPFDFSQLLFSATAKGGTVVVGDGKVPGAAPRVESRSVACAKRFHARRRCARSRKTTTTGTRSAARAGRLRWWSAPPTKRSTSIAMVSPLAAPRSRSVAADRLAIMFSRCSKARTGRQSSLAPGREARQWMAVTSSGRSVDAEKIASRLRVNPEFANKVYDTFAPGTTVIITDKPVVRNRANAAILRVEGLPPGRSGSR